MKKISFICCYTKEDLLNDLKKSTDCLTDYEIEWVLIDNRNNRFKSAASALNCGFNKSTSPIVIFLHHDIILYDQATIDRVVAACEKGNIAGFAGILPNGGKLDKGDINNPVVSEAKSENLLFASFSFSSYNLIVFR